MAVKSVLLFELPFAEEMRLSAFCREHGAEVRAVPREEYGRTLGQIAGIGNFPGFPGIKGEDGRAPAEIPGAPMMVLAGFARDELETFLAAMGGEKVPPVELKAMLTPVNAMWTPGMLYENLAEEHEAMTGRRPGRDRKDTEG